MIVIDAGELDWSYILQFWDPNQHFGERMTENLDQTLHTDTAKTVRPAASPWVLLVILAGWRKNHGDFWKNQEIFIKNRRKYSFKQ